MSSLEDYPRFTSFLWFDLNAEEAVNFYVGIFKNSGHMDVVRNSEHTPKGGALTIPFELDGQTFTALNGGPNFKFTEAISLRVRCNLQEAVDSYWSKRTAGGTEIQCGWLKDKFGLSWQIGPANYRT